MSKVLFLLKIFFCDTFQLVVMNYFNYTGILDLLRYFHGLMNVKTDVTYTSIYTCIWFVSTLKLICSVHGYVLQNKTFEFQEFVLKRCFFSI